MPKLMITIDDASLVPGIKKAIKLLRGVKDIAVYKPVKTSSLNSKAKVQPKQYPDNIQSLIGIASGINIVDVADERLTYLLSK
jgi:hypothetical protein